VEGVSVDIIICDTTSTSCLVHSIAGELFQMCSCLDGFERDPGDVTRCLSDATAATADHPPCPVDIGDKLCDPDSSYCVEMKITKGEEGVGGGKAGEAGEEAGEEGEEGDEVTRLCKCRAGYSRLSSNGVHSTLCLPDLATAHPFASVAPSTAPSPLPTPPPSTAVPTTTPTPTTVEISDYAYDELVKQVG
jgi:hypothetical protein